MPSQSLPSSPDGRAAHGSSTWVVPDAAAPGLSFQDEPIALELWTVGTFVVLTVKGDVDLSTAGRLVDALTRAASMIAGGSHVVVDLDGVTFLDSTGLSALALASRRTAGRLAICGARPAVRRLFTIVGLDPLLPQFASLTEACTRLTDSADA